MTKENGLRDIERKAYLAYHQDGLLDLLIGFIAFTVGIAMYESATFWMFMAWLPVIFYRKLKHRITWNRIGVVRFANARKIKKTKTMLLAFLATVAMVLATATAGSSGLPASLQWIHSVFPLIVGGLVTFIAIAGAWISGVKRFWLYALLIALTFVTGYLNDGKFEYNFIVIGIVFLLTGSVLLVKFLKTYPAGSNEVDHGED